MSKPLTPPRWAVSGAGRIGRVTHIDEKRGEYIGERLEGGPWKSKMPQFLHPDTQAHLEALSQLDLYDE